MLLALVTSKDAHRWKVCGIWDVSAAFFHSPMYEYTVVRPPPALQVRGKLWVLNRALYGTRMASRCFGKLVAEVLTDALFETVSIVPNTYHHPQRDIDPVVHGDDFVAVAEDGQLDHFEQVLENSVGIKRVGRIGPCRSSTGSVLKRVVNWNGDGFTWEADPQLTETLLNMLNLSGGKGALTPGGRDIRKDDRDIDCELSSRCQVRAGRCGTRAVNRSRPSRLCLQRQDSVTADVEAYAAHAASRCSSWALPEEQSEVGVEVPVSTETEEHRRVCGCGFCSQRDQSSLDPARRACGHCPRVSLSCTPSRRAQRTACTARPS